MRQADSEVSASGSNLSHVLQCSALLRAIQSTTTSSFVFFIESSSPRHSILGACFQKTSRAARRFRH